MVLTIGTISEISQASKDNVIANFTHMAFGTYTGTATSGDTALGGELVTKARQEYTELTNSVIISAYLDSTEQNGETIGEVGAKDALAGNLQSRKNLTDTVNKTSSNELWIDEEIKIDINQTEG